MNAAEDAESALRIVNLADHRTARESQPALNTGGGDGTYGGMEARIASLEGKFDKIDAKLTAIGSDLSYLKGKMEGMPSSASVGELKGRVDGLPTTAKMAGLMAIAVAALTIITKWSDLVASIGLGKP
ncbi:hypothetical protein NKH86_11935 [Mesorhizobium sp. M0913]|uniref:hypothetical protein n=1 Tax=Mesorhizobium sp. M0913 TaxID=2957026 RepID=UPI00333C7280